MQVNYNKKIDDIFKRIDSLNAKGLQLVLDMISDLESDKPCLYHKIKVLDKHNKVIQEDDIKGTPREYIEQYIDKYNLQPRLDFYNVVNGKLVYQPTIAERENLKNDTEIV